LYVYSVKIVRCFPDLLCYIFLRLSAGKIALDNHIKRGCLLVKVDLLSLYFGRVANKILEIPLLNIETSFTKYFPHLSVAFQFLIVTKM